MLNAFSPLSGGPLSGRPGFLMFVAPTMGGVCTGPWLSGLGINNFEVASMDRVLASDLVWAFACDTGTVIPLSAQGCA